MSVRVRVEPSGREFVAETHEPLLEAALRAGLNLRYNCNSGTCGECRARLLSGRLGAARVHDYPFSEAEKAQDYFLLCSAHGVSDLVIDVQELRSAEQIPHQRIVTRVARLERLGDSYAVVHLRTPRTQTLSFLAGQSADLLIEDHVRRFAIASCPCNGMVLQFHAHFDARDAFLRKVFALHAGDAVAVRGLFGGFQLDESSRRPLIMVAEGTGFAPIKSVIEHAVALEWPEAIRLLWLAEPGGHYLENYCRALEDAFDEFSFALCAISPGGDYRGALEAVRGHAPGSDIFAAVQPMLAASLAALAGTVDTRLFLYA